LSIPIFNRFYTDTRVEQYKVNSVIKEIEKLDAERTIKVDIKKNLLDLKNASENYIVSMKNVQFATENKRIVEERYKLGAETLMNVLLAETDFVNAQTQKITAVFEFYKNLEKIKYLTGK
jgi:outer membrane protein